jgi:pantetheine-phosphate adenylyltransferase
LPAEEEPSTLEDTKTQDPEEPTTFPVVALGGTFDHLHAGHKILLSMAALLARRKMIVGITGT